MSNPHYYHRPLKDQHGSITEWLVFHTHRIAAYAVCLTEADADKIVLALNLLARNLAEIE